MDDDAAAEGSTNFFLDLMGESSSSSSPSELQTGDPSRNENENSHRAGGRRELSLEDVQSTSAHNFAAPSHRGGGGGGRRARKRTRPAEPHTRRKVQRTNRTGDSGYDSHSDQDGFSSSDSAPPSPASGTYANNDLGSTSFLPDEADEGSGSNSGGRNARKGPNTNLSFSTSFQKPSKEECCRFVLTQLFAVNCKWLRVSGAGSSSSSRTMSGGFLLSDGPYGSRLGAGITMQYRNDMGSSHTAAGVVPDDAGSDGGDDEYGYDQHHHQQHPRPPDPDIVDSLPAPLEPAPPITDIPRVRTPWNQAKGMFEYADTDDDEAAELKSSNARFRPPAGPAQQQHQKKGLSDRRPPLRGREKRPFGEWEEGDDYQGRKTPRKNEQVYDDDNEYDEPREKRPLGTAPRTKVAMARGDEEDNNYGYDYDYEHEYEYEGEGEDRYEQEDISEYGEHYQLNNPGVRTHDGRTITGQFNPLYTYDKMLASEIANGTRGVDPDEMRRNGHKPVHYVSVTHPVVEQDLLNRMRRMEQDGFDPEVTKCPICVFGACDRRATAAGSLSSTNTAIAKYFMLYTHDRDNGVNYWIMCENLAIWWNKQIYRSALSSGTRNGVPINPSIVDYHHRYCGPDSVFISNEEIMHTRMLMHSMRNRGLYRAEMNYGRVNNSMPTPSPLMSQRVLTQSSHLTALMRTRNAFSYNEQLLAIRRQQDAVNEASGNGSMSFESGNITYANQLNSYGTLVIGKKSAGTASLV